MKQPPRKFKFDQILIIIYAFLCNVVYPFVDNENMNTELHHCFLNYSIIIAVPVPGFHRVEEPTPRFANYFQKCRKIKENRPEGGGQASLVPSLDSPMHGISVLIQDQHFVCPFDNVHGKTSQSKLHSNSNTKTKRTTKTFSITILFTNIWQ